MPVRQLATDERYAITYLKMVRYKPAEIARHCGTITRELERNPGRMGGYHDLSAQQQAERCRS